MKFSNLYFRKDQPNLPSILCEATLANILLARKVANLWNSESTVKRCVNLILPSGKNNSSTLSCKKIAYVTKVLSLKNIEKNIYYELHTANPVWFINSCKSFSIGSIPISNYMFLNRIIKFRSNGFCWTGSRIARQKHIFPNGILKVQLENYNSFPNYKLFPGLKNLLKEKEHNFKILNLCWKKTVNLW
jgi:hypothetical protein